MPMLEGRLKKGGIFRKAKYFMLTFQPLELYPHPFSIDIYGSTHNRVARLRQLASMPF